MRPVRENRVDVVLYPCQEVFGVIGITFGDIEDLVQNVYDRLLWHIEALDADGEARILHAALRSVQDVYGSSMPFVELVLRFQILRRRVRATEWFEGREFASPGSNLIVERALQCVELLVPEQRDRRASEPFSLAFGTMSLDVLIHDFLQLCKLRHHSSCSL